jgi:hypothetical protein
VTVPIRMPAGVSAVASSRPSRPIRRVWVRETEGLRDMAKIWGRDANDFAIPVPVAKWTVTRVVPGGMPFSRCLLRPWADAIVGASTPAYFRSRLRVSASATM